MTNDTRCLIEGCARPSKSRGWCGMHYSRWKRNGDPEMITRSPTITGTPSERFWPKVDASGDCWEWTGAVNPNGYGVFVAGGRNVGAHRFAYTDLVGPIDVGKVIDHLCRNRKCVNPDHLEMTTYSENIKRGVLATVIKNKWSKVTHCKRNHEYTPQNTLINTYGTRGCRTCRDDRRGTTK